MNWKFHLMKLAYGRWPRRQQFDEGYSVLLPTPTDMPFLLRLGLEGLSSVNTAHCREVLVILDSFEEPTLGVIQEICDELGDDRVRLVHISWFDRQVARNVGHAEHWLQLTNGIRASTCRYAFLHDSDAFFLDPDALERQYEMCRARGMYALGLQARTDRFFRDLGMKIAGTWELMFDVEWARRYAPVYHRGYLMDTPQGRHMFDNMLYPQYLDYPSGKIGVMEPPPSFIHFSITVWQYRQFRNFPNRFEDEFCRILMLSALEETVRTYPSGSQALPTVASLVEGLGNKDAMVTYCYDVTAQRYVHSLRPALDRLVEGPLFDDQRRAKLNKLLEPFDVYFKQHPAAHTPPPISDPERFTEGVHKPPRASPSHAL